MANELKFGNKVVFFGGAPLTLPSAASDPGSAVSGDLYYNTGSNVVKYYNGSSWQTLATGGAAANTALSNLASVAINTSLLPGADNSINLGSSSFSWASANVHTLADAAGTAIDVYSRALKDSAAASQLSWSTSGITFNQLTATTVPFLNGSKVLTSSVVTPTELGFLSGVTSAIQTQLNATEKTANKGVAGGYASLDGGGKVPVAQLPNSIMEFQGNWDASTNTPTLVDGTGNIGDVYRVNVAGTQNLGSGSQTFVVGDWVMYDAGGVWRQAHAGADAVLSVNGATGIVTVNAINQLTGDVTTSAASGSQSKVATLLNSAVTGQVLTGYVSGAGTVSATDSILQAIQKLNGNAAGFANTALSNLASVAINIDLLPNASNSISLGSSSLNFLTAFVNNGIVSANTIAITGDTTSGSNVITNIASTTGLRNGYAVQGGSFPAGSQISSVTAGPGGTITLSAGPGQSNANATATTASVSFSFISQILAKSNDVGSGSNYSGNGTFRSGNVVDGISGAVVLKSGTASGTGNSGNLNAQSGTTTTGTSGSTNFGSGAVSGAGTSGNVNLIAGRADSGTRGNVGIFGSSVILGGGQNSGRLGDNLGMQPSSGTFPAVTDFDNSLSLGRSANRYANVFTLNIDSGASALNLKSTASNANVAVNANGTGTFDVAATKFRRSVNGTDTTNFMEDQYFDSLSLTANVTSAAEISSSLSFALASFDGALVEYVIREATSNKTRVGQFVVSTDGTISSSSDQYSETAILGSATGLSLSADISGGNVRILYNNTHATNAATMRCNIRRIRT